MGYPQATQVTHISTYKELRVYQAAMTAAMRIFELSKRFPIEERYSLTDQIRRCSRSVCSNIGEAWRKRRYPAHFVSKLSDSEGEAEETRVWLEFSWRCGYMSQSEATSLDKEYDQIIGQLVRMIDRPDQWLVVTHAARAGSGR
jgi:four helix bundle protein